MYNYETKKRYFTPDPYAEYGQTQPDKLFLRRMTDEEYKALPQKSKDRAKLLFSSRTGLCFIVVLLFSGSISLYAVKEVAAHEPDSGMHLFISLMLSFFLITFSTLSVFAKLNRYVSRDSLVTAGEVLNTTVIRGRRNYIVGYDHVIALHSRREIVTVRDKEPVNAGNTVLIVKSRNHEYCLYEIPSWAAAYDREENDFSTEITHGSEIRCDDYSKYDKVSIFKAGRHSVIGEEYLEIPVKYRSPRPLSYGLLSVCWSISTLAIPVLLGIMVYARKIGNLELFMIILGCLICLLIMEWTFSTMAFQRQLPKNKTCCIECVPVRKSKNLGQCFISVIIPERKQYIDCVQIDPSLYDSVRMNEVSDLYFCIDMPIVKYIRSRYEYHVAE